MRSTRSWFFLAVLLGLAAAPNARAQVAVQGVIVKVTKDPNADFGTLTLTVNGSAQDFRLVEDTKFEIKRGDQITKTNVVGEHRGETAIVFAVVGVNPPTAAKVQILLPALPKRKPGPVGPAKPGHTHGLIVAIVAPTTLTPGGITVRLHKHIPPPPVLGTVTNVVKALDSDTATLTVSKGAQSATFLINPGTRFEKLKAGNHKSAVSLISAHIGENVVVFPRYGAPTVAAKVDILAGGDLPTVAPTVDHFVNFAVASGTTYQSIQDGKHHPATSSILVPGEEVSVLPTAVHSHVAADIAVMVPHSVHGKVTALSGTSITVLVHHGAKNGIPAHDTPVTKFLAGTTKFELVKGKDHKPGSLSAISSGDEVKIFPGALPPHAADKVEIHPKKSASGAKTKAKPKSPAKPKK